MVEAVSLPAVVVDIGNTRMKWGDCRSGHVSAMASLPPDDPARWSAWLLDQHILTVSRWAVASVHPARSELFLRWIEERGESATLITDYRQIPIRIDVEFPQRVGIDRLLNAAAVRDRVAAGEAAILVDAGTAVTVDFLDAEGTFRGGAILPGFRVMAEALHLHTAQLPRAPVGKAVPASPARNTEAAIEVGVFWSVVGGVRALIDGYAAMCGGGRVFVAGGDGALIAAAIDREVTVWPEMTLEGARVSAMTSSSLAER